MHPAAAFDKWGEMEGVWDLVLAILQCQGTQELLSYEDKEGLVSLHILSPPRFPLPSDSGKKGESVLFYKWEPSLAKGNHPTRLWNGIPQRTVISAPTKGLASEVRLDNNDLLR